MQAESEIDKFLAALCRWLDAVNNGMPPDMHRADIDAAYPCWTIVSVPSNIARLRELLSDYESHLHEARSHSCLSAESCSLYELLQRVYMEKDSQLTKLLASRETSARKATQLEEKLKSVEAERHRMSSQVCGARARRLRVITNVHDLEDDTKKTMLQIMGRYKELERNHEQLQRDRDNLALKLEAALSEAALETRQLNAKLRNADIQNGGLIQQNRRLREGSMQLQDLYITVKSLLPQIIVKDETLQETHEQIQQSRDNLQNLYNDLLRDYQHIEAIIKQLASGRQRRDSGLEGQATNLEARTIALPSDPQALHASIECSISLLHNQRKEQQEQLAQLEVNNGKLEAESVNLREDKASLEVQNVITRNSLASAQQAQESLQKRPRMLQYECNALWEHLIYLAAAREDAGEETVQNRDVAHDGWMHKATTVLAKLLQGVNDRQRMYYVLH